MAIENDQYNYEMWNPYTFLFLFHTDIGMWKDFHQSIALKMKVGKV